MTSPKLRVFVSSKMEELAEERRAVKAALDELRIDGWVFEKDAGARSESIQQTYLYEVAEADLYIGLFWKGYGGYTIEEYEHAKKSNKDCLIYEKRTDIENKRDPQLEDFLNRLGKVETGHTIRRFNTADELKTYVQEDVARWQTQVIRRKVSGAPNVYQNPLPPDNKVRQELSILASKVKHFWIKGVLEHSLHDQALIELRKENIAGAVEHPWETVLEVPDDVNSIPTDKPIQEVFEDFDRRLLILGAPGSGKTTTLLELARDLLIQNEKNADCALPAVFNLSSWADQEQPLLDWLVDELKSKYQIPARTGRTWLEEHRLLPLLDGLDEVKTDKQAQCVGAINEFIQAYPSGVVVCSRSQEYSALPVRLKLNAAICLQPLSLEQTDDYLEKAGSDLAALRAALKEDQNLQEIVKTPLMLSIVSLTYQNQPVEASPNGSESIGARRTQVFDAYIARMLERKGKQKDRYTNDQVKLWLGWLAQRMNAHSQTIFVLEQLQPAWLTTRREQILYLFISRLAAGLLLGTAVGLAFSTVTHIGNVEIQEVLNTFLYFVVAGLTAGILACATKLVRMVLNKKFRVMSRATGLRDVIINLGINILTWSLFFLSIALSQTIWDVLTGGILESPGRVLLVLLVTFLISALAGTVHWFLFGARDNRRYWESDIQTVETLSWSRASALKSGAQWMGITLILMSPLTFTSVYLSAQAAEEMRNGYQDSVRDAEAELADIENKLNSLSKADSQQRNELETSRTRVRSSLEFNSLEANRPVKTLKDVLIRSLATSFFFSLVTGFAGLFFGGIRGGVSERKTVPNQGIKLSIRNATFKGLMVGLIGLVITTAFFSYLEYQVDSTFTEAVFEGLFMSLAVNVVVGPLVAFRTGWFDVIKHYSLRFILSYKKYTPKDVVGVLNYASKLILMQRVGGGYIFIHRLLLEHFAAMDHKGQQSHP